MLPEWLLWFIAPISGITTDSIEGMYAHLPIIIQEENTLRIADEPWEDILKKYVLDYSS